MGSQSVSVEAWGPVRSLLDAATADERGLAATIGEIGLLETVETLVAELISRIDPPALDEQSALHLELTTGSLFGAAGAVDYAVILADGRADAVPGLPTAPGARLSLPVADLIRALYGSGPSRRAARWIHEALIRWPADPDPAEIPNLLARRRRAVCASHAVLAALRRDAVDLDDLAVAFDSDKWGGLHWYTPHYARHFAPLREEPVRLLEIGVGGYDAPERGGGSLRMWQRYFRRGLVYGLDLYPKRLSEPRIRTIAGDQNDPAFLAELAERIGPLDIVIDDGSHINEHVLTSFAALFPHLRPGGRYVIEDLQSSYWPGYGGNATDLNSAATSMGLLKRLADGLNHREYDHGAGHRPSYTDQHVTELHFYHNIAFITKGFNDECGPPRRPPSAAPA